jgi:hypothetical protein
MRTTTVIGLPRVVATTATIPTLTGIRETLRYVTTRATTRTAARRPSAFVIWTVMGRVTPTSAATRAHPVHLPSVPRIVTIRAIR